MKARWKTETFKVMRQLGLYMVAGGIATAAEWISFYVFTEKLNINYMLSTVLAFVISTFVNWLSGKRLLFKEQTEPVHELLKIYAVSVAGLLLNLVLMWQMVRIIGMNEMLSKMIATAMVFMWNFLIRKKVIYKI